ncbi:MAG: permease [Actinomycetes bacterium]
MEILLAITALAVIASLIADRRKTLMGVRRGLRMFVKLLPALVAVLAAVSLLMAAVHPATLERWLGGGGPVPFVAALLVGSIALIPGFVAFPLAGVLKDHGATVAVLAAFITTLLMVGVVTLPIEIEFFGRRIAVWRNLLAFGGAVVVALVMAAILS